MYGFFVAEFNVVGDFGLTYAVRSSRIAEGTSIMI